MLIVVAGPTASGKTSLSISLAQKLSSEIISADSRQVYKEMSIGTAKPDEEEMQSIKHHFINRVSIKDEYNVGKYESDVISFLEKYFIKNDIAILTGGTGLYIDAIVNGLDDFPDIDLVIKDKLIFEFEKKGLSFLQDELKKNDPVYYKTVDLNNSHRLIRALSVIRQSNQPYSSFINKKNTKRDFEVVKILLNWSREDLYIRINKRVDLMINKGLESEVKKLYRYKSLKALQTVGYKELFEYFDGLISKDYAIELIKRNSRRYAKRQMTWFRNKGEWNIFDANKPNEILEFVKTRL